MLGVIKQEIVKSRYFSISVDSTPDITRTDQLTIIIRHVNLTKYEPVERFLTFFNISSPTDQNLADTLLQYLSKQKIDFNYCCGQTYGKYIGMQQILKNKNSLVGYIPFACHSLNLIGQSAVNCCVEAVSYFGYLHQLYIFFYALHIDGGFCCPMLKRSLVVLFLNTHPIPNGLSLRLYLEDISSFREIATDDNQTGDT